ncbi:MAG: membrane protein [Saprospiraceae bacterium]|nr:MAG: membrane protein [Saprospiraceae bacterium]
MKRKILSLLFICLAFLAWNPLHAAADLTVKVADRDLIDKPPDGMTRLSLVSDPGKIFLDKTNSFLVEIPNTLVPAEATGMDVKVAGEDFHFDVLGPIYIEGLKPGEPEIAIQLVDQAGEPVKFRAGANNKIGLKLIATTPLIKNDAVVLGILIMLLALVFWTESLPSFKGFYRYVPALLLCYFLPSIFNSLGIISGAYSGLYFMSSRYLLPASLILLCLSIDLKGVINLGPKALIMFLTATIGIVLGGPVALLAITYFAPDLIGATPDQLWRGLSTIAGSWIGGGANQTAMKEIFEVGDNLFASMIVVDVVVANIWMGFLLYGASISDRLDKVLKADNSAITELKAKVENYRGKIERIASTKDLFILLAVAFGGVALSHWGSDMIIPFMKHFKEGLTNAGLHSLLSGFFWLVVFATTLGLVLSFTKARKLEGVGASRWGSVFIYILVATIGMKMDLGEVYKNLGLFAIGIVWMLIHVSLLLLVAKLIRAPFFFVAVGSQANIGGAASAPIVASAFSPALAPVGVLMAVLGYALGTYGALICAFLMRAAAGG